VCLTAQFHENPQGSYQDNLNYLFLAGSGYARGCACRSWTVSWAAAESGASRRGADRDAGDGRHPLTATGTGPQPTLTPETAVGTLFPGRTARWLDRTLRIANEGPRPFYRAGISSLAVTSVLAMTMAALIRPPGSLPGSQRHMIVAALLALCISAVLGVTSLLRVGRSWPPAWLDRVVAPRGRAAIWLALAAWFPFLLIVVYYRAEATFPPPVRYIYSPYDDKRWETAAYLLGTLAPVIWVTTAARVLAISRRLPPTWRAWFAGLFPRIAAVDPRPQVGRHAAGSASNRVGDWRSSARRVLPVVAGLATALGLAWYFLGPSWHLMDSSTPISRQEDVWLIGLQAIAKGHLPYVGVAEVPYGPGTQLTTYLLMHHVTSFSMVGFREAWALQAWAGASVLFAVFFLAFGYVRGLAASLLGALFYPALSMVGFHPGGSFDGYFGWASPLRYVGMIALILLLPAVVRRCPSWRGAAAGTAIGALWGLMSYMAQENLAGGAVGTLVVGALLLFSGTSSWRGADGSHHDARWLPAYMDAGPGVLRRPWPAWPVPPPVPPFPRSRGGRDQRHPMAGLQPGGVIVHSHVPRPPVRAGRARAADLSPGSPVPNRDRVVARAGDPRRDCGDYDSAVSGGAAQVGRFASDGDPADGPGRGDHDGRRTAAAIQRPAAGDGRDRRHGTDRRVVRAAAR